MKVLAFFAHPDDETMLAGGTLALLARAGATVHYLCATRGEGGELGEPPLYSREDLALAREEELLCAVGALGGRSLTFLGYQDPLIGENDTLYAYTDNLMMLAGQIAATLRQFRIQALFTHGVNGEYGHPAHVISHQAARLAIQTMGDEAPALYSVSASFPEHPYPRLTNADEPAHLVIDIVAGLEAKTKAALCHRTQHALFVRRASEAAGRPLTVPEVIIPVESLHRVHPPVSDGRLEDPLARLLQAYVKT